MYLIESNYTCQELLSHQDMGKNEKIYPQSGNVIGVQLCNRILAIFFLK